MLTKKEYQFVSLAYEKLYGEEEADDLYTRLVELGNKETKTILKASECPREISEFACAIGWNFGLAPSVDNQPICVNWTDKNFYDKIKLAHKNYGFPTDTELYDACRTFIHAWAGHDIDSDTMRTLLLIFAINLEYQEKKFFVPGTLKDGETYEKFPNYSVVAANKALEYTTCSMEKELFMKNLEIPGRTGKVIFDQEQSKKWCKDILDKLENSYRVELDDQATSDDKNEAKKLFLTCVNYVGWTACQLNRMTGKSIEEVYKHIIQFNSVRFRNFYSSGNFEVTNPGPPCDRFVAVVSTALTRESSTDCYPLMLLIKYYIIAYNTAMLPQMGFLKAIGLLSLSYNGLSIFSWFRKASKALRINENSLFLVVSFGRYLEDVKTFRPIWLSLIDSNEKKDENEKMLSVPWSRILDQGSYNDLSTPNCYRLVCLLIALTGESSDGDVFKSPQYQKFKPFYVSCQSDADAIKGVVDELFHSGSDSGKVSQLVQQRVTQAARSGRALEQEDDQVQEDRHEESSDEEENLMEQMMNAK
nr:MAG: nucleoprotein [Rovyktys virus]